VILEGVWDCDTCGSKGIGLNDNCPNCNKPHPDDAEFYLPDNPKEITDAAGIEAALAGPDWICSMCSTNNAAKRTTCSGCSAPRGDSKSRETFVYQDENVPHSEREAERLQGKSRQDVGLGSSSFHRSTRLPEESNQYPTQKFTHDSSFDLWKTEPRQKIGYGKPILVILGLLFVVGVIFFITRTHEVAAKVTNFSWSRTIFVQTYKTVREEDWSIPVGGRQVSVASKFHHNDQVIDHYKTVNKSRQVYDGTEKYACGTTTRDLGNGRFDRQTRYCDRAKYRTVYYTEREAVYRDVPVYRDSYTYDIDKWVDTRTVPTSGLTKSDPAPHWGNLVLLIAGSQSLGSERESRRVESYTVTLTYDEGKTYTITVPYADWMAYDSAKSYTLVLNNLGTILNDPLRPEAK
jgi:hypothetical protein